MKKSLIIIIISLFCFQANSQVLISLLFGDKLNSENIEFGLEGGMNFASLDGISSNSKNYFNLGFYFDFNIKQDPNWIFYTGVIVKSNMGAKNIDVYSLNNTELDTAFSGGSVQRKISYFNVPLVLKRNLNNHFYLGLGGMVSLRSKAKDIFTQTIVDDDDLTYELDIKDKITTLDAGLLGTFNYKIKEGGMNIFFKYYYGLVNINKIDAGGKYFNRSIYLGVGIPIGANVKKDKEEPETSSKKN